MEKRNFHIPGEFAPRRGVNLLRVVGMTLVGVVFAVGFALVFGLLVMLLWNWIMPVLFGLKEITYWQAFGIVVLAKLLFGAFGPQHRNHSDRFRWKFHERRDDFRAERIDDDMMIEGWKYYKQYWREEGKAAFENYLRRIKEKEAKKSEE